MLIFHIEQESSFTTHYYYTYQDSSRIRFRLIKNTQAKYSILDEDIYNFDETGF